MCIGIPMQVIRSEGHRALCRHGKDRHSKDLSEEQSWVDMSLVGEQPADSWVLVFLEAAREPLTPERAAQMLDALTAMQAVMAGDSADLDTLFADLVDREPQLPAHLQAQPSLSEQKNRN